MPKEIKGCHLKKDEKESKKREKINLSLHFMIACFCKTALGQIHSNLLRTHHLGKNEIITVA